MNDYTAYGLRVRSALPLPIAFLPVRPEDGERGSQDEPDVTVRLGEAPATLPGPARAGVRGVWEAVPGTFVLNVDGVARYLVHDGAVSIHRCASASCRRSSTAGSPGSPTGTWGSHQRRQHGVQPLRLAALTVDNAADGVHFRASSTGQGQGAEPTPSAAVPDPDDPLRRRGTNGNGRITCREAREHGIALVRREHPAYRWMRDGDGDGVVCE